MLNSCESVWFVGAAPDDGDEVASLRSARLRRLARQVASYDDPPSGISELAQRALYV